jgi:dynein heavy chain
MLACTESVCAANNKSVTTRIVQFVVGCAVGLPHNEMVPRLKEMVNNFKLVMPVITSLRNTALRQRHWFIIENITGRSFTQDRSFTLGNLLDMQVRFYF